MASILPNSVELDRSNDPEVVAIEEWWKTPKHINLHRSYNAAQIASLRSPLRSDYPANKQALKLWGQLQEHRKNGTAEMTFGMIDPLLASQMVGQQTIYISGALCAFSEAECSGQDTSDYPWDTVPRVAERMFRSQIYHDRRQRQYRSQLPIEAQNKLSKERDYLQPLVADADMGFGSATTIVKLVQRLVEAGVAMFHIDDLAIGMKRFTENASHTIVPMSEYLQRLCTARLQLDIMGAETILLTRCDVDGAQYITSTVDHRDHAHIRGATKHVEPFASVFQKLDTRDQASRKAAHTAWIKDAGVMVFDDAVKKIATESQYEQYIASLSQHEFASLDQRRTLAEKALDGQEVYFDWDLPRTEDGRYSYSPSAEAIIERCLKAAAFGEVTWARMDFEWKKFTQVHEAIANVYPQRCFAGGYSATYNFEARGFSADEVRDFHKRLAKLGVVWQVQPGFAMQGLNYVTRKFSEMWAKEGIAGYIRDIQEPAMLADTDGYEKMEWSGGYLADAYLDLVKHP